MKQNDKVWEMVTNLILELLIDAREQGIELLSFEEVCVMLGVDDVTLMAELERDENYILNQVGYIIYSEKTIIYIYKINLNYFRFKL